MAETLRVVVSARKGGVGKSALTVLLARWLADKGHRVLVIDLDPQRTSSGERLGAEIESPLRYTAVDLALGPKGRPFAPQTIVAGRLDVVAANQRDVSELEYQLRTIHEQRKLGLGAGARRAVLDLRLAAVEVGYDFVVMDTPTYFGEITTNALEAAHLILSPFDTQASLDTDAMLDLLEHMDDLGRRAPVFFVPNKWDSRLKECRLALARAQELAGDRVLEDSILPKMTEVVSSFADHRDIAGKGQLAKVFVERLEKLGGRVIQAREARTRAAGSSEELTGGGGTESPVPAQAAEEPEGESVEVGDAGGNSEPRKVGEA